MRDLSKHADRIAERRVSALADALVGVAATDLPGDLTVEKLDDGLGIRGSGLVRRLAFDGRLRGLTLGLRSEPR